MTNEMIKDNIQNLYHCIEETLIFGDQASYQAVSQTLSREESIIFQFDEGLLAIRDLLWCWNYKNVDEDIFYQCANVEDIKRRYQNTRWFVQRIEYGLYDHSLEAIYSYILENRIGISMLSLMVKDYVTHKEDTFFRILEALEYHNDFKRQFRFISFYIEKNPDNKKMHMKLAELYLKAGKKEKALETLMKLTNADEEVKERIAQLKEMD